MCVSTINCFQLFEREAKRNTRENYCEREMSEKKRDNDTCKDIWFISERGQVPRTFSSVAWFYA